MAFEERTYTVLMACASDPVADALKQVLPTMHANTVTSVGNAAAARTLLAENEYDIVIVVSPLTDEFGLRFARELRSRCDSEILLIVPAERFEEIYNSVMQLGIICVSRPMSKDMLVHALRTLCTMRERIRGMQRKQVSLEDKMAEIRLINHAKWLLIERLSMSEAEAQRFVEKQAMNLRISKKQLAQEIIKQYE
ncbi:MAG: response regulator [Coriobacteriales bacterium]|nr:response regulator [Coriobacteriales bacterium]